MILHEQFDAENVLKTVEREKVTYIGAVPMMCERMLSVLEVKSMTPCLCVVWRLPAAKFILLSWNS